MDLRTLLQATLGTTYTIERELGGGGMSRVFLAEETRFHRRVVIKVLSPELARELSAERFEREITVAAQLQQANIVPVLAAGEVDGLPYFTMPFVEGQSLRSRMERGAMPFVEIVPVLRDVARALAYAHERGIVHRDIKPENILLSGGSAMVTDFGIAKALQESMARGHDRTLTTAGTSLGTPAYMAPEQAAGDEVDTRADLYAWGVVAYELLAGHHPFHKKTTSQQLIAAHIAERPVSLSQVAPAVPASLATLVMCALNKDAALRVQSAQELARALDDSALAGSALQPRAGRLAQLAMGRYRSTTTKVVAVGFVAVVIGLGSYAVRRPSRGAPGASMSGAAARVVAVAPFENRSGVASLGDVSALAQDRITARLVETQVAPTIRGMEGVVGTAGALGRARSLHAALLVTGVVFRVGDSVQARADILDVASGQVMRAVGPLAGPKARAGSVIDDVRERVVGTIALTSDPLLNDAIPPVAAQTPTYAAFREFAAGEQNTRAARWSDALTNYTDAFRLDSTFTFAAVREARSFYHIGRCDEADSLAALLLHRRDRLSEYEHAVLDRTTTRCRADWVAALDAARRMVTLAPASADARLVYGVSALYLYRAEEGLKNLRLADSTSVGIGTVQGARSNVNVALHLLGRHDEERHSAEEAAHRFPGAHLSYDMVLKASAAQGDTTTVERLADEVASLPVGGTVHPDLLLLEAARETRRHGHPASARRLADRLVQFLDGVPEGQRNAGYWQTRAEAFYALGKWPEVIGAVDSADARLRSLSRSDRVARSYAFGVSADDYLLSLRGRVAARRGRVAEASAIQRTLLGRSGLYLRGFNTRYAAEIAGALGRRDEAMRLLRQSMQQGQMSVDEYLDARPDFDAFKDYVQFVALFAPRE